MIVLLIALMQAFLIVIARRMCRPLEFKMILYFNLWWLALVLISVISPVGGYTISLSTYLLITAFLLFVSLGFICFGNQKNAAVIRKEDVVEAFGKTVLKSRIVYILTIGSTFLLLFYASKYTSYVNSGNVLDIRNIRFFVGPVFGSTIELLFYNYIISAARFLWAFIVAYILIYRPRKGILLGLISGINFALYAYIGASRYPVVLLGVNILVLYVVKSQYAKKRSTLKTIGMWTGIGAFAIVLFFGMSYFTAYRLGMQEFDMDMFVRSMGVLYEQIIEYNVGALGGLDKSLETGALYNHWFFGRAVWLGGVEEIADNFCGLLGIDWTSARYVVGDIANESIDIGSTSINALYTHIYWFYSDMGVFGVCAYSFIFGALIKKAIGLFVNTGSVWGLMLMTHMLYSFFLSNATWDVTAVDSLVYMAFIFVFMRYKERRAVQMLKT